MSDFTSGTVRRIVLQLGFEAALGEVSRALRDAGLFSLARIDVRDHFIRDQHHVFRMYQIIESWAPDLAVEALDRHPDAGVLLPIRVAVYELAAGETAVLVHEPSPVVDLASIFERQSERLARALATVHRHATAAPLTA